ncbi:glycosyltransferase [Flavobacterium branchiarum]|uniref:Glycosyltransferase n=1 Tax=Flavobacterium branchiarum TaxID=1114870 RepID=A0ABV5FIJ2_9FLAO|nr:glycosyltransferase [Flavobacterium branchiarum]MDN3674146.1 glycosyltransferase [Flavobacterium branchiarum]
MIKQNKKYKIALVGYRLSDGGLEKVMSSLSIYFGKKNIDIHNILFDDSLTYPYSGKLVNIGKMKVDSKGILGKLKLFLFFRNYIIQNKFDYVVDFRYRVKPIQELILSKWIYNLNTIYTVHSSRLETYLPSSHLLTKLICNKKYALVCVSQEIKSLIVAKFNIENVVTINNPVDIEEINVKSLEQIDLESVYIIAAGRFDSQNVKQFDRLIIAYSNSILPKKNISLVLLGNGELEDFYKDSAITRGVADKVHFLGFKSNPYNYFKNALFLVLCSKYEGFPMVLIESLACETPVVSFDCTSGPNEIIMDKKNGLLVENQNFDKLTNAMNLFVEDHVLYNQCKNNSLRSIESFSIEKIGKQWQDLMGIDIY